MSKNIEVPLRLIVTDVRCRTMVLTMDMMLGMWAKEMKDLVEKGKTPDEIGHELAGKVRDIQERLASMNPVKMPEMDMNGVNVPIEVIRFGEGFDVRNFVKDIKNGLEEVRKWDIENQENDQQDILARSKKNE